MKLLSTTNLLNTKKKIVHDILFLDNRNLRRVLHISISELSFASISLTGKLA